MRNAPPDLFVERFNGLLREAEDRGVSVAAIADATGVHRSAIYRWRDGRGSPEGSSLAAVAFYFDVSMDWLWGRPGYGRERADSESWDGRERRRQQLETTRQ